MKKKIDYDNWSKEELIKEIVKIKSTTYGLVWHRDLPEEKIDILVNPDARTPNEMFPNEMAGKPFPVLKEVKGKAIESDKSKLVNLLIEGDNYHSLAVLNFTHREAVDLIYIDPPYNTGNNDFIYNDKFVDREDSFRHSKWLSFMEKRLKLARNLLKPSGVIFISINDNEQAPLKMLCDEIYNENNFVGQFIWKNKLGGGNDSNVLVTEHEYILVYVKDIEKTKKFTEQNVDNGKYLYEDEYVGTRGKFSIEALYRSSIQYSESLFYPIKAPDGTLIYPNESDKNSKKHIWRWSKDTYERKQKEGRVMFKETKNGWRVFSKQYFLEDDDGNLRTLSARSIIDFIGNRQGTELLKNMFENEKLFNNPKPIQLIKYLIQIFNDKSLTVLDFMAGSGTTGHAVLELNKEDSGSRKFILCTNNENNICAEICYPRIKKAIKGYKNPKGEEIKSLGGNLKYYKTDFVEAEPTDKNKRKLVKESTDMLCILENAFELVQETKEFKIFKNTDKYMGVIFYDDAIEDYKKAIKKIDGHFRTYVFSMGDDPHTKKFADVKGRVTLCAIPEVILKVYREIFK